MKISIVPHESFKGQATAYYLEWRKKHDVEIFSSIKPLLDKANTYTPEEYQHRLLSAIYYFVVDKNLKAAIKELEKCSQIPDPTWRLSKAFLLAYKGKMDDAVRYYNAAFKLEATHQVHFETEEFIDWVLQEE